MKINESIEEQCWRELRIVVNQLPAPASKLSQEVFQSALDYGQARGRWLLASNETRHEIDRIRTLAHNRFIDACNALSRACAREGLPQEWRRVWGDARTGEARKRIGDFACFIAYRMTIEAR